MEESAESLRRIVAMDSATVTEFGDANLDDRLTREECLPSCKLPSMARLFISYNHAQEPVAFAIRQWLIEAQNWAAGDIFVDVTGLGAGQEWEKILLTAAEEAELVLFLASEESLSLESFCYRELLHAKGHIVAITLNGIPFDDPRIARQLPHRAKSRHVIVLDQTPTQSFSYTSPIDQSPGSAALNPVRLSEVGIILRELGIAPDSFPWIPAKDGPYPGLAPLREGDEAIFYGRDLEIRDGINAIENLRSSFTQRVLLIQAPSGAGKSSFLRAGLWKRLRRNPGFTPLAIIRPLNGAIRHEEWGLVSGLYETLQQKPVMAQKLSLTQHQIAARVQKNLPELLAEFADVDHGRDGARRTLLLGIDQAEEIAPLVRKEGDPDDEELAMLLGTVLNLPEEWAASLDIRLVLTVRDDSVDRVIERLAKAGLAAERISTWRLNRLPRCRFRDIIDGPANVAARAGWKLKMDSALVEAIVAAAAAGSEGGDSLPVLALTLERMVKKHRDAESGQIALPVSAKEFLEHAISGAAIEAREAAGAEEDDLRRLIIPALVTWDAQTGQEGAAKRRIKYAEELFRGERASLRKLADALVAQRLLTVSGTGAGTAYEVAHEALFRVPPLDRLISDRRRKFELDWILRSEAKEWYDSDKAERNLVRFGARLQEALRLLDDPDFGLDLKNGQTEVEAYLNACRQHQSQNTVKDGITRVWVVISALALVAVILLALINLGIERVIKKRDFEREQAGIMALQNAANQPTRYPDQIFYRAWAIGFAGYRSSDAPVSASRSSWSEYFNSLTKTPEPFPILLPQQLESLRLELAKQPAYLPFWSGTIHEEVKSISFDKSDLVLRASSEGNNYYWDLRSPEKCHESPQVAFKSQSLAVTMAGNEVRFRAFGKHVDFAGHAEATAWAISQDQQRLAIGYLDGRVVLWNLSGVEIGPYLNLQKWVDEGWIVFDGQQVKIKHYGDAPMVPDWLQLRPSRMDLNGTLPVRNGGGMSFVELLPGKFPRPSKEGDYEDWVSVPERFWIGKFEVTQAEWARVMEDGTAVKDPFAPVTDISWEYASEFCERLTKLDTATGTLPSQWLYRLPTEEEWEYACRAGSKHDFSFGLAMNKRQANFMGSAEIFQEDSINSTVAAGSYPANAWGIYDMHGNVREWCWEEDRSFPPQTQTAPVRGGSYLSDALDCRASYTETYLITHSAKDLGFRLVIVKNDFL